MTPYFLRICFVIAVSKALPATLIEEETNLPMMVEKALREIEKEDKDIAENTEDSIIDENDISLADLEATLKDKDYSDFEDFLEEESRMDADYLSGEND